MSERFLSKEVITSRQVNPLDPDYIIPQASLRYLKPGLKYLRNSIDVNENDINKAQSKPLIQYALRDNMNAYSKEIPNSNSQQPYMRPAQFDNMNYNDFTDSQRFINQRRISPFKAQYDSRYYGGEKYHYGDIDSSKPASFSKYTFNNNYNLRTSDIEGAQPGTKHKYSNFKYANSLSLSGEGIIGTKAGSRLRGIATKRQTNPLDPQYDYLGWSESKNYCNGTYNPYGDKLQLDSNQNSNSRQMVSQPCVNRYEKERNDNFTMPVGNDNYKQYFPNDYYNNEQHHRRNVINNDASDDDYNEDQDYLSPAMNYQRIHDRWLYPSLKEKQTNLNYS